MFKKEVGNKCQIREEDHLEIANEMESKITALLRLVSGNRPVEKCYISHPPA